MSCYDSRVEEDLLGQKEVPMAAYYGIQSLRAQDNFSITGYKLDENLICAVAYVKKAAALTNMEIGRLDEKIGHAIVSAADDIIDGKLHDQFIVDPIQGGAGTSINMNANEVIANRALELIGKEKGTYDLIHPNNHVNMAQSTNDAIPTAIHIALLTLIKHLELTIEKLIQSFDNKSKQFEQVIKMGRTHLQDAVPIRLGQEFASYAQVLKRDLKRINQLDDSLYEVNIGATAVGTGLNADPRYIEKVVKKLTELTGFPMRNAENLVDATQNTDVYVEVSSALKI